MLHIDTHITSTTNPARHVPHIRTSLIGVFYLGLIGQFPYQALEKIVHHPTLDVTNDYQLTSDTNSPEGDPQASTEDYEKEDKEAFNYQAQPRRLSHDSCLQRKDLAVVESTYPIAVK